MASGDAAWAWNAKEKMKENNGSFVLENMIIMKRKTWKFLWKILSWCIVVVQLYIRYLEIPEKEPVSIVYFFFNAVHYSQKIYA
jgi:hypothetical protein